MPDTHQCQIADVFVRLGDAPPGGLVALALTGAQLEQVRNRLLS